MIETGCYIDNSAGIYTQDDVLNRLVDLHRHIDLEAGNSSMQRVWLMREELNDADDVDHFQINYEMELELESKINETLTEQAEDRMLMLCDGAYCIVLRSEWEDE